MVLSGWVDTTLSQQAGPSKCHQMTQLVALLPTNTQTTRDKCTPLYYDTTEKQAGCTSIILTC